MQIVLNLQGHRLLAGIRETLSSGSKEVDEIKLEVDETWKGFGKTAVFCVGKKCQYTVVDEVTQTAKIPAEVLRNEAVITIGIVGFKNEAVMTSTLVAYQVEKGSVVTIEEPEPSIYAEILSRYADLATRFNNIIANAGDLTNNAELIDARVGADDVVYDTLGEAVRGQINSLSEDISFSRETGNLSGEYKAKSVLQDYTSNIEWEDGYFYNYAAQKKMEDSGFSYFEILMEDLDISTEFIRISATSYSYSNPIIFLDNDGEILSGYPLSIGDFLIIDKILKVPNGTKKIVGSIQTSYKFIFRLEFVDGIYIWPHTYSIFPTVQGIKETTIHYSEKKNVYLNKLGGKFVYNETLYSKISDSIPCKEGDTFLYKGFANANVASACFYYNDRFIKSEQYQSTNDYVEIIAPANSNTVIFSSFHYVSFNDVVFDVKRKDNYSLEDVKKEIEDVKNDILINNNVMAYIKSSNILYGKKYVACGDSYTEGDFTGYTDSDGLSGKQSPYLYDSELGMYKTYPYWIAKRNGMELVNEAKCGTTMALSKEYQDGTQPIEYRNPFSLNRYKQVPLDADYLTLMFGLNESSIPIGTLEDTENTTIIGAYNVVLEYLITNMPYCRIGIIISDAWLSQGLVDAIKSVSEYWGIPWLDLRTDPKIPMMIGGRLGNKFSSKAKQLRDSQYTVTSSNMHPNIESHKLRSEVVENFLRSL